MAIIDVQVHCYERDHPGRPWAAVLAGPPEVTGAEMIAAMDAVGVDAAILVSPYTMYRYDPSYAVQVRDKYPDRFAMVRPFDPGDPSSPAQVAEWARQPGAVGARIMLARRGEDGPDLAGVGPILKACAEAGIPVNLLAWGLLDQVAGIAAANPDTTLVIDHIGLLQPFEPPVPAEPWADLPKLLALAQYPNVVVKISGACTLSHRPFPHDDIWDPLRRIFDAFGIERCMWGTDWTRAVNLITYEQGVAPFRQTDRLSDAERAALMGGNLERVYNWTPGD
ncbi:MAG: amidohydrolase family protein [Alphaproteobacteria bacterium]